MSYLCSIPNKRFKFRSFVLTTCRLGLLQRTNNLDITCLNRDMKINKVPIAGISPNRDFLKLNLPLLRLSVPFLIIMKRSALLCNH